MPKIKPEEPESPQKSEVAKFLDDGHPNPVFFPLDGEGFEDFQAAIDEKRLWSNYFGKLYRVAPLRSTEDKPPRVCKFASTLSMEQIEKNYGGRKWSAWISRRLGTGGKDGVPMKFQFDIEAPAIYQDQTTSSEDTANRKANGAVLAERTDEAMLKELVKDLIAQRDRALQEGKSPEDALQKAVSLMDTGYTSALQSVTANMGKGDSNAVAMLMPLITELIKTNAAKKDDPIMQMLLQKALEKTEPQPSLLEQLPTILGLLKDLGVRIGPARAEAAADGLGWPGVVQSVVEKVPEIINGVVAIGAQRAAQPQRQPMLARPAGMGASPAAAPGNAARRPGMGPQAVPGAPQAQPGASQPEVQPSAASSPGTESAAGENPQAPAISPELLDRIAQDQVKATIVRMLFKGDTGDEAAHFAERAHEPFARWLAETLKNNAAALQGDPILSQAMTHVNVMEFAQDFIAYFEPEEPDAGEQQPAEPPPAAVAPAAQP